MMKKLLCVLLVAFVAASFSGCGIAVEGTWQMGGKYMPADSDWQDTYYSEEVSSNWNNDGRLRKKLVFGDRSGGEGSFSYIEERFWPDRERRLAGDKGRDIIWEWRETYRAEGTYRTSAYNTDNPLHGIPNVDTEMNATITYGKETRQRLTEKTDVEGRRYYEYYTSSERQGDDENPLLLRALLGLNPFDELLVVWARGKSLDFNESINSGVETYIRVN